MKIVFLCGSLEPGRDGVGDYTRRLACELIRKQHDVAIVALNDRKTTTLYEGMQVSNDIEVPVLRLPGDMRERERFAAARNYIGQFNPEWVSLQYVPFSFEKRGLPFSFTRHLTSLGKDFRWHVMFHELWVGLHGYSNFKLKVLGLLQKVIIRHMLAVLNPASVTTSIGIYKKSLGWKEVNLIPLFSNIPIAEMTPPEPPPTDSLTAIHFGSFTGALNDYQRQVDYLKAVGEKTGRTICLEILGDGGVHKDKAVDIARRAFGEDNVIDHGFLSEASVSGHMLKADVGISRADYALFGKSGSSMAMLEHGLPVLLRGERPEDDMMGENYPFKEQLVYANDPAGTLTKKEPVYFVNQVSDIFLDSLQEKATGNLILITRP
ncbi:glycosyltransferase family protein [Chitinophaga rhizophila]|uniref:Glycosyltransferase n=1 Tax=Chitinophaga rhizophila TaxID=2866212 RepID=A0ABS7GAA8_9BACT|nr:glycosyltransferase [Chitinophaga rhizophila]MBW8684597.1 glycosyltransferase [Chitinophaga rhizophila]